MIDLLEVDVNRVVGWTRDDPSPAPHQRATKSFCLGFALRHA